MLFDLHHIVIVFFLPLIRTVRQHLMYEMLSAFAFGYLMNESTLLERTQNAELKVVDLTQFLETNETILSKSAIEMYLHSHLYCSIEL